METLEKFVDYLHIDYLCGTDSLDSTTCATIMRNLSVTKEEVCIELHKLLLSNFESLKSNSAISVSTTKEKFEEDFEKYCNIMLKTSMSKIKQLEVTKITKDCMVEIQMNGLIGVGFTYNTDEKDKSDNFNVIAVAWKDGGVQQVKFPNKRIMSLSKIQYSHIK